MPYKASNGKTYEMRVATGPKAKSMVHKGTAYMTSGGLKKCDILKISKTDKQGRTVNRYVSLKKHEAACKAFQKNPKMQPASADRMAVLRKKAIAAKKAKAAAATGGTQEGGARGKKNGRGRGKAKKANRGRSRSSSRSNVSVGGSVGGLDLGFNLPEVGGENLAFGGAQEGGARGKKKGRGRGKAKKVNRDRSRSNVSVGGAQEGGARGKKKGRGRGKGKPANRDRSNSRGRRNVSTGGSTHMGGFWW